MKYIYLAIWIAAFVSVIIVYFQVVTYPIPQRIPFFSDRIPVIWVITYVSIISIIAWIFLTLWVKWILDSNKDLDDGFDL